MNSVLLGKENGGTWSAEVEGHNVTAANVLQNRTRGVKLMKNELQGPQSCMSLFYYDESSLASGVLGGMKSA